MEFSTNLELLVTNVTKRLATTKADIELALVNQRRRIQERTRAGLDINGAPFHPYSLNTPKKGPVTLGDLSNIIQVQVVGNDEGHIFVPSPKDVIAKIHNTGSSRMPMRHFFGISQNDKALMIEDIRAAVMKRSSK